MPRHPIPLLVLARLAVHSDWQGRGLGAGLLLDALGRTLQVADIAGARALAVHAKDDSAASFYRHFGFIPSVTDSRHLFKLIKDIRIPAGLDPAEGKPPAASFAAAPSLSYSAMRSGVMMKGGCTEECGELKRRGTP
jgi:Acetyltransferase (GNAT) domain